MNSTFASSYELLLSAISELELQKDSFVLHPGVDFSRKRKISFRDTILSLLTMQGGSLSTTSHDFFQHRFPADIPSLSAIHQQRAKLLPDAMSYLFYHFTQKLPAGHTYDGFQLLACDGSDLNICYDPADKESCKPSGNGKRGSNQLHLHALYDLCNKRYTDIRIEKTMVSNESRALVQMLGNISTLPERSYWLTGDMKLITFLPISWQKACLLLSVQRISPAGEGSRMVSGCLTGNWTKTWIFLSHGARYIQKRSCPL